jgi:hypothetical protein
MCALSLDDQENVFERGTLGWSEPIPIKLGFAQPLG